MMRSIWSSVVTSGGQNVMEWAAMPRVITPSVAHPVADLLGVLALVHRGRPHAGVAAGVVDEPVVGERLEAGAEPCADPLRLVRAGPRAP